MVDVVISAGEVGTEDSVVGFWVSVTGQTVVPTTTVSVVTWPTGQLVTVSAHDVTV